MTLFAQPEAKAKNEGPVVILVSLNQGGRDEGVRTRWRKKKKKARKSPLISTPHEGYDYDTSESFHVPIYLARM